MGVLVLKGFLPPTILVLMVLGSIFAGVATPTEAGAVGALGAILLAAASPLALSGTALAQDRATWNLHSMFPSSLPILGTRAADLVEIVDEVSQGSLPAAWSAGGAGVARVWDSYREFREHYAVWRNLGYLD